MRLFIGVWLSEAARGEVVQYINMVKGQISGFKWSAPEQLHFTLKYLGETPEKALNPLTEALQRVTSDLIPFELHLGQLGFFPEKGTPRILWLGLAKGQHELESLAGMVEVACIQSGFQAADRPFKPHLTIARAKEGQRVLKTLDSKVDWKSSTLVTGFSLIESKLQPGGAVYRNIREFLFV